MIERGLQTNAMIRLFYRYQVLQGCVCRATKTTTNRGGEHETNQHHFQNCTGSLRHKEQKNALEQAFPSISSQILIKTAQDIVITIDISLHIMP